MKGLFFGPATRIVLINYIPSCFDCNERGLKSAPSVAIADDVVAFSREFDSANFFGVLNLNFALEATVFVRSLKLSNPVHHDTVEKQSVGGLVGQVGQAVSMSNVFCVYIPVSEKLKLEN